MPTGEEPPDADEATLVSRAERELAELEEKLGLTGRKPGNDDVPRWFMGDLGDLMGGMGGAACPSPVVPPRPRRPATDAKALRADDEQRDI